MCALCMCTTMCKFSGPTTMLTCRALPTFISQLENVSADPEAASYAASALWALMHRGERVKATLKGIPGAVSSVARCLVITQSLLEHEGTVKSGSSGATQRVRSLLATRQGVQVLQRLLGATTANETCKPGL